MSDVRKAEKPEEKAPAEKPAPKPAPKPDEPKKNEQEMVPANPADESLEKQAAKRGLN